VRFAHRRKGVPWPSAARSPHRTQGFTTVFDPRRPAGSPPSPPATAASADAETPARPFLPGRRRWSARPVETARGRRPRTGTWPARRPRKPESIPPFPPPRARSPPPFFPNPCSTGYPAWLQQEGGQRPTTQLRRRARGARQRRRRQAGVSRRRHVTRRVLKHRRWLDAARGWS
jgi:hypothetical protein